MPDDVRLETLSIRSDPVRIREARLWVSSIARTEGFSEAEATDLAVALSEICANAHRHSYCGRTDGRIDLQAEVGNGKLKLTVRDYGVSFDVSAYRAPVPSELPEAGYGIYIARNLMDRVEYTDVGVGTQVVLVKSRRSGGAVG